MLPDALRQAGSVLARGIFVASDAVFGPWTIALLFGTGILILVGLPLFLAGWLLGSIGWGVLLGTFLLLDLALVTVLVAIGASGGRQAVGLIVGVVVAVVVDLALATWTGLPRTVDAGLGIWLGLIGYFLSSAAESAIVQTGVERTLRGVRVRDVMEADPASVSPNESVANLIHERMLQLRSAEPTARLCRDPIVPFHSLISYLRPLRCKPAMTSDRSSPFSGIPEDHLLPA